MPHSPRFHEGGLYVLNSGAGELWRVDLDSFRHEVVCSLPGYLPRARLRRALRPGRPEHDPREACLRRVAGAGAPCPALQCGVAVVDVRDGREVALFEFTGGCTEIFDVRFLPGVLRPMILNGEKDASRQAVTAPGFSYWLRPAPS